MDILIQIQKEIGAWCLFADSAEQYLDQEVARSTKIASMIGDLDRSYREEDDLLYSASLFLDLLAEYFIPSHSYTGDEYLRLSGHYNVIRHINSRFNLLIARIVKDQISPPPSHSA